MDAADFLIASSNTYSHFKNKPKDSYTAYSVVTYLMGQVPQIKPTLAQKLSIIIFDELA